MWQILRKGVGIIAVINYSSINPLRNQQCKQDFGRVKQNFWKHHPNCGNNVLGNFHTAHSMPAGLSKPASRSRQAKQIITAKGCWEILEMKPKFWVLWCLLGCSSSLPWAFRLGYHISGSLSLLLRRTRLGSSAPGWRGKGRRWLEQLGGPWQQLGSRRQPRSTARSCLPGDLTPDHLRRRAPRHPRAPSSGLPSPPGSLGHGLALLPGESKVQPRHSVPEHSF